MTLFYKDRFFYAIYIYKAPWINSELKKGMRDRDAAKTKAMTSNDPRDYAKYKKLRNTINNNILLF